MKDTFGHFGDRSSPSFGLQRSLESRLRRRMAAYGSPEYELTWRHWDMPAGPRICALRASLRIIYGQDFSGWPPPTPTATDGKGSGFARKDRGPRNNLRDWFKINYKFLYPPVKVVAYMMGYTQEHLSCAPTATPSSRKSRRSSSPPAAKPSRTKEG